MQNYFVALYFIADIDVIFKLPLIDVELGIKTFKSLNFISFNDFLRKLID